MGIYGGGGGRKSVHQLSVSSLLRSAIKQKRQNEVVRGRKRKGRGEDGGCGQSAAFRDGTTPTVWGVPRLGWGGFIGFIWNHIFCVIDEPAVNIKDFIFISFSFLTVYDRCGT